MSVLKGLLLLCCTAVVMGNASPNCSLPVSPLMCSAVQGISGRDGRDGMPGRDGPAGPPGAPGTAAFDLTAIRDQIRDEVLRDIDSKLSQSKQKCHNLGHFSHLPATSCQEVFDCNQGALSGQYWINTTNRKSMVIREVYCDMENVYGGSRGGWMRVAFFNMSDPTHSCPSPHRIGTTQGRRLCTRSVDTPFSSVVFHTHRVPYTAVCGRAVAYQYGKTNFMVQHKVPVITLSMILMLMASLSLMDNQESPSGHTPQEGLRLIVTLNFSVLAPLRKVLNLQHLCKDTISVMKELQTLPPLFATTWTLHSGMARAV